MLVWLERNLGNTLALTHAQALAFNGQRTVMWAAATAGLRIEPAATWVLR
jgi:hypothetical protein